MANALWITLIGMSLVFVSILLLWGLMALLVGLTSEKKEKVMEEPALINEISDPGCEQNRKRRAAAAAVAFAMARRLAEEPEQGVQPTELVTAWQAVNRARQINQQASSRGKKVNR